MPASENVPADSREVRARLVEALRLDLVGPWAGHELEAEQLPGRERPSNWYVAGFLIPTGSPPDRSADADEDDDLDTVPESAGLAEESNDERKAARKAFFPSSSGLSFLVVAACRQLAVTVRWGDYAPAEIEDAGGGRTPVWRRTAHEAVLSLPLGGTAGPVVRDVPGSGGLQLHVAERPIDAMGPNGAELPAGTRSVSCFLVNRRPPDEKQPDRAYAFQAEIEVRADDGFVPRPDLRGAHAEEWDEQVADLHYADTPEYATGHGVSAEWDLEDGGCRAIRTAWIGAAEVEKTVAADVPGVELSTVDKFASLPWVGAVRRPPRRGRPRRCGRVLRRRRTRAGEAAGCAAPAARPRHPGRAAPDRGTARHHGRPLRDGDRGACGARGGRTGRQAEDRRLDRDGAPGAGPDSGAVRAADDPGVPPAGAGSPRHVLRPDPAVVGDAGTAVRRHRLAGPEPQGPDAPGAAGADGGGCARVARGGGRRKPAEPRRSLHDGAGLLQQPARAGRGAADPRGGGPHHRRALRGAAPGRRDAPPVPRPHRLLRGARADLARLDRPGGRGAASARMPVRRPGQPRRLRAGDEHDLGRSRHSAPRG